MLKQIALLPFVKLPAWLLRRSINEEERLDIRDSKKWQFTSPPSPKVHLIFHCATPAHMSSTCLLASHDSMISFSLCFFSHLFQASLWIPFTPGHRGFSSSRASWSREGHWEDQRDRADRHRERQTKRSKRSKRSKTEGKRWKPRSITFGIAAGIATCSAAFGHVLGNGFGLGWAPGSIISLSKVVMTLSWTLCMQDREVIQGPNRSATSFYCQENKVDSVVHDPSTPAPFLRQPCFSTSFIFTSFTFTQFCRHTKWAEQQQASGTTNIRFFCTQSLD